METNSNFQLEVVDAVPPPERRPILLRAYAEAEPVEEKQWQQRKPSEWVLVFDTETRDDEAQRLRFGSFQLREGERLELRGLFYDPDATSQAEQTTLAAEAERLDCCLLPVGDFIEKVLFLAAYKAGATVVGFNLPFDLSRIAIGYQRAGPVHLRNRKKEVVRVDRSMVGGFTFRLSDREDRPNLRVKHLSRRLAFINFAYAGEQPASRSQSKRQHPIMRERGFFLDLKTFAAALTSESHTLDSLSEFLDVPRKTVFHDFGREIDTEFIGYAMNDADVTWQCYRGLMHRYEQHKLTRTLPHKIYSEASLGKAYLREMGIKPWRQRQPDFDPKIIGAIMSSYFGGRAEVHRRREIVRTLYCDFASMYPTVCTLMELWKFVIADGMTQGDAKDQVQAFLSDVAVADLQHPKAWREMRALVQVLPDADIFPVRARYGQEQMATIGLNYLSADRPLWFTLADCVASKLLTGRAPKVIQAIRFEPKTAQTRLRSIAVAGNEQYLVDPAVDDFYKSVIDLRRSVKQELKRKREEKADPTEIKRIDSEQLALKILANATSYGIFIELNVEEPGEDNGRVNIHTATGARIISASKSEKPGEFFHPLLATLITGAARLMLALTERLLLDEGLDWAFCDTDSMAFAAPEGMALGEFEKRVRNVCAWFERLNPYEQPGSILEFEDQNFALGEAASKRLEPLYCAAISAKRYALFNLSGAGEPLIRKASAHGLGHLLPPYAEEEKHQADTGVRKWQEDVWKAIIKSLRSSNPLEVRLDWREELSRAAVSQYTAATPDRLDWFKDYNRTKDYPHKVKPFNFLLEFYAKRPDEMARDGLLYSVDKVREQPKPIAPYSREPFEMLPKIWDRVSGKPLQRKWLRTYADALRGYHRHPENKFLHAEATDFGATHRRHVFAEAIEDIGKEADKWDEDEPISADDELTVSYGLSIADREKMLVVIQSVPQRQLARAAHVSTRTIPSSLADADELSDKELRRLFAEANALTEETRKIAEDDEEIVRWLSQHVREYGVKAVAKMLDYDEANLGKIIKGKRRISGGLRKRISEKMAAEMGG